MLPTDTQLRINYRKIDLVCAKAYEASSKSKKCKKGAVNMKKFGKRNKKEIEYDEEGTKCYVYLIRL